MTDDSGNEPAPGSAYLVFLAMEELQDKLKLLNYERDYCKALRMKPISSHYFAIPTNPGEQFHAFTSLCAWLIRSAGGHMEQPQEYDDPNAVISQILDEVRRLEKPINFPPSRLKSGCGDACIEVASYLVDAALAKRQFHFSLPDYPDEPEDNAQEDNLGDDEDGDQEITEQNAKQIMAAMGMAGAGEDGIADMAVLSEDDTFIEDEEELLDVETMQKRKTTAAGDSGGGLPGGRNKPDEILHSTTDSSAWLLEVERVLPQLKVTIRSDTKDWRSHLDQMRHYKEEIEKCQHDAKTHLDRMHDELARTLEKIQSREKYINSQMEPLLQEYRAKQDTLAGLKEKYRKASGGITERSRILAEVTEELERVKQNMDERGASMTDGSPVVRIKQAIQRLKQEMIQMDIRIGVLEHILLQGRLRVRTGSQKNQGFDDGMVY